MYSNRQSTYIAINQDTNGKNIGFPITLKPLEKINLSFQSLRINNLIPNITKRNNKLNFHTLLGDINITIPVKYYDAKQLRDYLNKILNGIITVVYEDYQFSFVSTAPFSILDTSTCKRVLGLSNDTQEASLYPAYTLIPPSKCDMNQHYIRMKIKELNITYIEPSLNRDNTLIKIPIHSMYGTGLFYEPSVIKSFLLQKTNIRTITLILSDDYGNIINDHFECVLRLEYVYVQPDQQLIEEKAEKEDDVLIDPRFTHYDGEVKKTTGGGGGFIL